MKNKMIVFLLCLFCSLTAYADSLPRFLSIMHSNLSSLNLTSSCNNPAGFPYVKKVYAIGDTYQIGGWCITTDLIVVRFTTISNKQHQLLFKPDLNPIYTNEFNNVVGTFWEAVTPIFTGTGDVMTKQVCDFETNGFYKIVVFDVNTNTLVPDGLNYFTEESQESFSMRMASSATLSEDFQSKFEDRHVKSKPFKAPMFIFPTAELRKRRML